MARKAKPPPTTIWILPDDPDEAQRVNDAHQRQIAEYRAAGGPLKNHVRLVDDGGVFEIEGDPAITANGKLTLGKDQRVRFLDVDGWDWNTWPEQARKSPLHAIFPMDGTNEDLHFKFVYALNVIRRALGDSVTQQARRVVGLAMKIGEANRDEAVAIRQKFETAYVALVGMVRGDAKVRQIHNRDARRRSQQHEKDVQLCADIRAEVEKTRQRNPGLNRTGVIDAVVERYDVKPRRIIQFADDLLPPATRGRKPNR